MPGFPAHRERARLRPELENRPVCVGTSGVNDRRTGLFWVGRCGRHTNESWAELNSLERPHPEETGISVSV